MSRTGSRRLRRGPAPDSASAPNEELPSSLNADAYRQVDDALWSFAQRRLGPVLTAVGGGFLGPARPDERRLQEIQLALRAYATLGWADARGTRVVDMFAAHGVSLGGEQRATLAAFRQATFGLYGIDAVEDIDMTATDVLREETFTLRDRHAAAVVEPGDLLLAWLVPSQTAWHPVGAATLVPARARSLIETAVGELSRSMGCDLAELPAKHPVHLFWTVFRVVNAGRS